MNVYAAGAQVIYGKIGHFFAVAAFVLAITSALAYFLAVQKRHDPARSGTWLAFARKTFLLHVVMVIGIFGVLFLIVNDHLYAYKYAWSHSSRELPFYYQFSAMWAGQEGSTLLWMFWHGVLGAVLIFRAGKWEAPVMSILALAQLLLGSMLLGIYFFGYKMGSSPFALLRDTMDIPIFKMNPDYIPEDGTGLNPSLQNYWMVIHPPTLFLGFAAVTIPAAFAIASLWVRNYVDWVKAVLPWTLFALMILGAGILMGGAWAYEALSFGGFWAWDPVENASLVPWLVLAAGLHTLMSYKHTGYSLHATYVLLISAFLLVMYSSFLTKSGVLGDASVHSFTDMGMSGQLIVCILAFLIPSAGLFIWRTVKKDIPSKAEEEKFSSREFWLFIGALVFVFASVHIIVMTSFPVINKILGTNLAPPSDIKDHYNRVQVWMAVLAGLGSAGGQFFKYKQTDWKAWAKQLTVSLVLALFAALAFMIPFKVYRIDYILMLFFAWFSVFANIRYIFSVLKGKLIFSGGSVTHIGFAVMMVGILISQGEQQVISLNKFGINYGKGFSEKEIEENVLLYQQEPQDMGDYRVTYLGDSAEGKHIYFNVRYEALDKSGKVKNEFVLHPNILINAKMGNNPIPSTRKTLFSDLYTHITSAPLKEDGSLPDSLVRDTYTLGIGDTVPASRCLAVIEGVNPNADIPGFEKRPDDIAIGIPMQFITMDTAYRIEPVYFIREMVATSVPVSIPEYDVKIAVQRIIPEENKFEVVVEQKLKKYLIMKAIRFPFINVLWLGIVIMLAGIFISMRKRMQENRAANVPV